MDCVQMDIAWHRALYTLRCQGFCLLLFVYFKIFVGPPLLNRSISAVAVIAYDLTSELQTHQGVISGYVILMQRSVPPSDTSITVQHRDLSESIQLRKVGLHLLLRIMITLTATPHKVFAFLILIGFEALFVFCLVQALRPGLHFRNQKVRQGRRLWMLDPSRSARPVRAKTLADILGEDRK